jgi:ketosteroid isomerase-like protein
MHERDKDKIRYHIDTVFRAYIDKDWAAIRASHLKDWRGFTIISRSTIKGIEAYMAEVEATLNTMEFVDYEMMEIDYLFYTNVCVVPYIVHLRGTSATGELFEIKLRALDVYVQQNGNWDQIASNVSLHPDTIAAPRIAATVFKRS